MNEVACDLLAADHIDQARTEMITARAALASLSTRRTPRDSTENDICDTDANSIQW